MKSFATITGILFGCTVGFILHSFLAALWWTLVSRQLLIVFGKIITSIVETFHK